MVCGLLADHISAADPPVDRPAFDGDGPQYRLWTGPARRPDIAPVGCFPLWKAVGGRSLGRLCRDCEHFSRRGGLYGLSGWSACDGSGDRALSERPALFL